MEADSKHLPKLLHEWGMIDCKGERCALQNNFSESSRVALPEGEGRRFRSSAAIANNYLSQDRAEVGFSAKILA